MVPPRRISKYKYVVIASTALMFGNISIIKGMANLNLERLLQNQGAGIDPSLFSAYARAQQGLNLDQTTLMLMNDIAAVRREMRDLRHTVRHNNHRQDNVEHGLDVEPVGPGERKNIFQSFINSNTGQAISRGWDSAIYSVSTQTFVEMFKGIPDGMKKFTAFLAAYAYKLSFGTRGLTWNGLAKINNRLYTLFLPLTGAAAQTRDRQRRADLIGAEQTGVKLAEHNWQVFQTYLLRELQHAQNYIKQALPCYDVTFLNAAPHGLKIKLARFIQACSLQDSKQVSFYSAQALDCLAQLIKLVKEFKSLDQAQQNHEHVKRWLSLTCNTFEQIALILEGDNTQRQPGRLVFSRLSAQSQATMPALDALLSGVGGLPGAPAN